MSPNSPRGPQDRGTSVDFRPLLTVAEVAGYLKLSLRTTRRLIADGKLPVVRIGRTVRVRPQALEALIEKMTGADRNGQD